MTADARQDEDGGGEGVGGPDAVLGSERAEHSDLEFREHQVGRQVGLVTAEQGHEEDALRDDQIDGRSAGETGSGAVGEFLDLAAGIEDPVPILDAPAPGVVLDDPAALLGCVCGQGGEQQPADRRGARRRTLLLDEHALQAHRRLAAVFAAGGREFDGVGVKRQGSASPGAPGTRWALAALGAPSQPCAEPTK